MTNKYNPKTGVMTYDCDQPGCRVNYEARAHSFKDAWRDAQSAGWVYVPVFEMGISKPQHFCPRHAAQFDKPRGG